MHRLTRDQFRMLVHIVIEDSGADLTRLRFNDAILLLFESIPGFDKGFMFGARKGSPGSIGHQSRGGRLRTRQ